MKISLIEIKNNLQGNNSKVYKTENQINALEHKEAKNNHTEQQEEKIPPEEDCIKSFRDNFKRYIIHIIEVSEREEKELEIRNLSKKIVKENFSNLVKEIDMQVQEARESQTRWMQGAPLQDI